MMPQDNSQNTSYSDSSKTNSNNISNLSEKLKILGGDVSFTRDKTTVPKRRGTHAAGVTVKRKDAMIDLSLTLEETRKAIDPREELDMVKDKCKILDIKKKEEDILGDRVESITEKVR